MHKRFIASMFLVLISVLIAGCVTRLADFTIISTKNIDLARGADFKRGQARVEGEDKVSIIIIIPTGEPNIKEAIDRAIESVPGAIALLDGVIYYKTWYIPYIFGEVGYTIEGTPLIDPKLLAEDLPSNFIVSTYNNEEHKVETRYISEAEYRMIKDKLGM